MLPAYNASMIKYLQNGASKGSDDCIASGGSGCLTGYTFGHPAADQNSYDGGGSVYPAETSTNIKPKVQDTLATIAHDNTSNSSVNNVVSKNNSLPAYLLIGFLALKLLKVF